MPDSTIAYCGPAALPDDLWTRWNVDPLLIAILVALAIVVGRGRSSEAKAGWGAIVLMLVIFVSPLCAMSSALFSVRVLHHVLLIAAVAPLLALAFPQRRAGAAPIVVLVAAHAAVLWLWHTPGPYTWGLASVPAYWLMQISLLGSAWLLWRAILVPGQAGPALPEQKGQRDQPARPERDRTEVHEFQEDRHSAGSLDRRLDQAIQTPTPR